MPRVLIELPHVGESVTEGVISKWLVQPGTHIRKYDPLVEVMTDKVNMEVPSPYEGTLIEHLVTEGQTVPMGQPIARIEVEGNVSDSSLNSTNSNPADESNFDFEFVDSVRSVGPTGSGKGGLGRRDALQDAATVAGQNSTQRLSPLVKRLLEQHNLDAGLVPGTGSDGRITKEDIFAYIERNSGKREFISNTPASTSDSTDIIEFTPTRRAIADHMVRSSLEIPSAWTMIEIDVTGLVGYREAHVADFELELGVRLTYLPFAAYVLAQSLVSHQLLNGRYASKGVTVNRQVNLGVAVATERGLVVPVVPDAARLTVRDLAVKIDSLIKAARSNTLSLHDVQGGTCTLNNTGALGSIASMPIINHPQVAIVTTEAIVARPSVMASGDIGVRSMMNVCLTFDHRVCDGAEASAFLSDVKNGFESIDNTSRLLEQVSD